jgi:hypothetical protein
MPVSILWTIRPALHSHFNFSFVFLPYILAFLYLHFHFLFHCIHHIDQMQGQAIYSLKQTGTRTIRRRDSASRWRHGVGHNVYPPILSTTYISKHIFFLKDYRIFKENYCKSKLHRRGHLLSLNAQKTQTQ